MTESPLNSALRQFEAAEANLLKAERVLSEIAEATPTGISFGSNRFYEDLSRDFEALVDALPLIDGWKPACRIMELDEIAQARLDAMEIDEFECTVALERQIDEPASDLRKYRHSFDRKRRQLIREALIEAIDSIDGLLRNLAVTFEGSTSQTESVDCPQFSDLRNAVAQIATLLGSSVAQPARWNDLERNLHFGLLGDLNNIITHEWPRVKSGLLESLYGEREPIPTEAQDLGDLVRQSPQGRVATKLAWDRLSPEDFERLIFVLIASESGYENPEWLMKTTAPDRGRDLSATRVLSDPLSGTQRQRVIIQCKHWLSKSVGPREIEELRGQMKLWEPPSVDIHIVATSGRFTSDAVALVERHNQSDSRLRIEMWADSHMERLLASRPAIIAQFGLR